LAGTETFTYTYSLEDPKADGQFLQLKISRKSTSNEEISKTIKATTLSGTSKTTVISKFLEAKSGLVVSEEVPGTISLYYLKT
jgi:hypothetical protein